MVGRCKVCGRLKYNLHDKCLTEIPWLCHSCRELNTNPKPIVKTVPKQKTPVIYSIKRLEVA